MIASKLHQRDAKKRKKMGFSVVAGVPPKLPAAKTEAEKAARAILKKSGFKSSYIHIYNVHEMMEKAYEAGHEEGFGSGEIQGYADGKADAE